MDAREYPGFERNHRVGKAGFRCPFHSWRAGSGRDASGGLERIGRAPERSRKVDPANNPPMPSSTLLSPDPPVRRGPVAIENGATRDAASGPARTDGIEFACVMVGYACIRLLLLRTTPLNSDEPQHAHVAWALGRGLVPYRDVFDNHAPLFHLLFAPLMALLGETPNVIGWLRLAMIPVAMLAFVATAWIGRALWSPRVALLALVLLAAFPPYVMQAGQFRTDGLWAASWIATIGVAVSGRWCLSRATLVGVMVGTTLALSLKTLPLLAGLVIAWVVLMLSLPAAERPTLRTVAASAACMLLGALLLPLLVVGYVGLRGGLASMQYDVWTHNLLADAGRTRTASLRIAAMLVAFGLLVIQMRSALRAAVVKPLAMRRLLVVSAAAAYLLLLVGTWPLLTRQDYLPAIPLLALGVASWWFRRDRRRWRYVPHAAAVVGVLFTVLFTWPFDDRLASEEASLKDVLSITTSRDPVMDDKGASVYRMRPFYFALEDLSLIRMRRGLIRDDIRQRLLATNTHVVWASRLPPADLAFVQANYVNVRDGLRVSGHRFGAVQAGSMHPFLVQFPGRYVLIGPERASIGRIDGVVANDARWLASGLHRMTAGQDGRYTLLWQPAMLLATRPGTWQ